MRNRARALRRRLTGRALASGTATMIGLMLVPACERGPGGGPEPAASPRSAPTPSRPIDIGKIIPCDVFTGEEQRSFSITSHTPGSGKNSRWCTFYTNQTTQLVSLTLWKQSAEVIIAVREKRKSELEEGISPRIKSSARAPVNGRKTYQYHEIRKGLGEFGCGIFFPIDRESSAQLETHVGGTCEQQPAGIRGRWERMLAAVESRLPPLTP